jgi:hypothetical protein
MFSFCIHDFYCRRLLFQYRQCCVFPPFFIRDIAHECGAILILNDIYNDSEIATLKRETNLGVSEDHFSL